MRRFSYSLLGLLVLLIIFAGSAVLFLPIPFTRDQGIYSYVAWCWVGEWWPYKFAFEHKGPWLYLIYAIFLQLSRGAMWGPNLADLLSRMSTVALVWVLARRMFNSRLAFIAALCTAVPLLCLFSSCWWNGQAETFIMPLAALATLFAFEAVKRPTSFGRALFGIAAGAVLSQMLMVKPSGFWLILGLLIFLRSFSQDKKKIAILFLLGLFLGLFVWLCYFRFRGIGREFFDEVILFNLFHLEGGGRSATLLAGRFAGEVWLIFGLSLLLVPAGVFFAFKKNKSPEYFLALAWLAAALLELLLQGRFFFYHLLILIPPCAVILAIAVAGLTDRRGKVRQGLALAMILIWALSSARIYFLVQRHYRTLDYLEGKTERGQYYARFQEPLSGNRRDFNTYATWVVANWIRERTAPSDYVLVFGYEPGINYLAARRSPSRFHSDYPLDFPARNKFGLELRERFRKIFLAELEQRKPKLVVLVHNDINALAPIDSYHQAIRFPEFWDWLLANYRPGERIEDFEFWWRTGA